MLNFSFRLRTEKMNQYGYAPVLMTVFVQNERFRKNVADVRVKPKHWSKQRVKPNAKNEPYNLHLEYNIVLDDIESKLKRIYRDVLIQGGELTLARVMDRFEGVEHQTKVPDIFQAMKEFIQTHRSIRAEGTLKKYTASMHFVQDFNKEKNYKLSYEKVNQKFYEAFRDYAYTERHTLNNYFGKLVAFIKTFMNWSLDRGYHSNLEFKKFKTISNDIEVIYLTMEELLRLYHHEFSSKRLSHVRDLYCFACFTGLRFSDLKNLKVSNIFGDHILLTVQKTKSTNHKIPLNKMAKSILEKYQGTLYEPIPKLSGQKFNSYIKECCQLVGIEQPINTTRYIGKKRVDKTQPKYELITSHTARKTFVTNSLILGMNERVLKNITGHNDDASFKKYLKIAEDFKRNEMSNTWDRIPLQ